MQIQATSVAAAHSRPQAPSTQENAAETPSDVVTWTFAFDSNGLSGQYQDLRLKGNFNFTTGKPDPKWNEGQGLPLRDDGKGGDAQARDGIYTLQVPLQADQSFQWGVEGTGPNGQATWLVAEEQPLGLSTGQQSGASTYAPVSHHLYGSQRQGEDISFRTWSPALGQGPTADYKLHVDVYNAEGKLEKSLPMSKDAESGDWSLKLPGAWKELEGKTYLYAARNADGEILKTSKGDPVQYIDPHARHLMGQQRGLEKIFVDPVLGFETGWYDDSGKGGPNYADNPTWGRFHVDNHGDAEKVQLLLRDAEGRQLNREQLLERLGEPKFTSYDQAAPQDKRDADVLGSWSLANSPKIDSYLWTHKVNDDGSIEMHKVETNRIGSGWTVAVNNFPALEGLKYEFQVYKTGQLVGDLNRDGQLQPEEARKLPFNEPHDNTISARPGSARRGLIRESSYVPRYQDTPRIEPNYEKKVIFELHLGSFLGPKDNALAATAEDLVANLDYLKEMGVTDLYMMPTQEFGGKRDWGYTTDHYFAGADAYGFEMKRDQAVAEGLIRADEASDQASVWISGTDAIQWLNDQCHKRGFDTMGDVVYNHTSGKTDGDNPLWAIDGDANSFFKWWDKDHSFTPWGAKPAFDDPGVKRFFADHAAQQIQEMGFDNLRFDFTQVLHNTGSAEEQIEGMNTLRQINRTLQMVKPGTITVAEDFSRNWLVAADLDESQNQWGIEKKGMGFQAVWNDGVRESIYKGVEGTNPEYNMDRLMHSMQNHYGVSGWDRAVLYAHSHDEVGNSGKWVGRAAAGSKDGIFGNYARAAARAGAALTLTGPGVPMLWQGEEFLANNDFKHGLTSTWGYDTNWLNFKVTPDRLEVFRNLLSASPAEQKAQLREGEAKAFESYQKMNEEQRAAAEVDSFRAGHHKAYKDLVALRRSSDAFAATSPIERCFTHNGDRVIAYKRGSGNEEFVVVTNLSGHDRQGYGVNLPGGKWKEVFNSNAAEYGGTGLGNFGATLEGGQGLTLPAGSSIVLKKVG